MQKTRLLTGLLSAILAFAVQAQAPASKPLPPALLEAIRFTIAEIRIEGNTLMPVESLLESVKPFLGSSSRLDDLNGARRAIVQAYQDQGYELLSVDYDGPRSKAGIHYFVVHEVRLGKVRVTGNRAIAEAEVRRQFPGLREGDTPRLYQVARELFLFNDNPGRNANLEYSAGGPGITDVEIKVTEQPQLRTAATYNNTGSLATGVSRLGLYAAHANFLGRSHQVTGTLTTSDRPDRVMQAGFGYVVPIAELGDSIVFSASYSDVDSGRVADLFNISGKGATVGLHYQRSLARTLTSRHMLDIGYDERRFRDVVDFFGTNLGVSVTDKLVSLGYRYNNAFKGGAVAFGATVQQNIPGGKHNDDATYAAARAGADARWQSWQFDATWQREFGAGWMTEVRLAGQYANEPLIAAEQFGLGGAQAVRGFGERDGAGDRGARANLEVHGPRFGDSQRLLGFFDFGRSQRLNAQPGERAGEGVSSIGVGWRGQFRHGPQVSADYAYVLNGTARDPKGDQMLHLTAIWWF
ncbi:MAG: ShlB/FhaC/HecB family hemolysin secretion/activation protein [Rhodocyclales bacterium]|nr:ShlB/FhaC/HecB family hemolysin secretion/activation protein [Rhodocyclales bacterium]